MVLVTGKVWIVNVVGTIPMAHGVATEASFGPFFTPEDGGDWVEQYRQEWAIQRVQVIVLTSPGAM